MKLSAEPRDENHPYGHGKAEFLSAAIEGTLMIVSSILIIYEAINNLRNPHHITAMDTGILITAGTALFNWLIGFSVVAKGKKNHSRKVSSRSRVGVSAVRSETSRKRRTTKAKPGLSEAGTKPVRGRGVRSTDNPSSNIRKSVESSEG